MRVGNSLSNVNVRKVEQKKAAGWVPQPKGASIAKLKN